MAGCRPAAFRAAAGASIRHQNARARTRAVARLNAVRLSRPRPTERRRLGIERQPLPLSHRLQQLLCGHAKRIANGAVVVGESTQALEDRFPRADQSAVDAEEDYIRSQLRILPLARLGYPGAAERTHALADEAGAEDPPQ